MARVNVPALGVFDAVSLGNVEMGHGAAYYWKGKACGNFSQRCHSVSPLKRWMVGFTMAVVWPLGGTVR